MTFKRSVSLKSNFFMASHNPKIQQNCFCPGLKIGSNEKVHSPCYVKYTLITNHNDGLILKLIGKDMENGFDSFYLKNYYPIIF